MLGREDTAASKALGLSSSLAPLGNCAFDIEKNKQRCANPIAFELKE